MEQYLTDREAQLSLAMSWLKEAVSNIKNQVVASPSFNGPSNNAMTIIPPDKEVVSISIGTVKTKELRDNRDNQSTECCLFLVHTATTESENAHTVTDTESVQTIKAQYKNVIASSLPLRTTYTGKIQHVIDLIPGTSPTHSRPYRMSGEKKQELSKQIRELIRDERIFPTTSPYGAPVLFVKKKDGTRRLCVDYRKLNSHTIKSRFPLPLIDNLFDQLAGAKFFSSLDLISGYHQIPIKDQDRMKTAFLTHEGQFAWRVMPFGLTSAPSTFQMLMNGVLRDYLNKFVVVYLDDILVYSPSKEQHAEHLSLVLDHLRAVHLTAKESKCSFFKRQIHFLGHMIDGTGIHMDNTKLTAITS
ncbi:reverse transcriptase family protein KNAG_0E02760 [Huiozyma naganishii CBS 8797]|uniref:Reverse transcriptase domain-containing protein n=1 Tax=Huiozyma naganishii (strain ATCC MYA-139 / BCRC 22969 / CBS 8797 / KCTC 17520 / NBRC 10181 / NCYC 3082 / Yp74L-3) TaxID=1071383 RepID=J7R6R2_HUIN7|nr:hypothetical protein KNAG_0E02760 [Kazachstania naganishii CBS 8797]CCK70535.1 hypothetical protein KNAG_0E02760 [Kazachstania naganishii CBS 8797]